MVTHSLPTKIGTSSHDKVGETRIIFLIILLCYLMINKIMLVLFD